MPNSPHGTSAVTDPATPSANVARQRCGRSWRLSEPHVVLEGIVVPLLSRVNPDVTSLPPLFFKKQL